jgi:hypothetical protein
VPSPFTIDYMQIGTGGPLIAAGFGQPPPAVPGPQPPGSFYIDRDDGSWWQRGIGGVWVEIGSSGPPPPSTLSLPNGDTAAIDPGMPVVVADAFTIRGDATSQARTIVIGIAITGAAPTLPVSIVTGGQVALTVSDWSAIVGGSTGLTPGAIYYLGGLGTLTTTSPSAPGSSVTPVGQAVSNTTMIVSPSRPVLL